jgi:hypothetical protein
MDASRAIFSEALIAKLLLAISLGVDLPARQFAGGGEQQANQ